jgi:hypothetical protein
MQSARWFAVPMTSNELRDRFAERLGECSDDAVIETAPGWLPLIAHALCEIESEFAGRPWRVLQIKEKFGELRIYTSPPSYAARGVRDESTRTCMGCGAPADPVKIDGWVSTLCELCATRRRRTTP